MKMLEGAKKTIKMFSPKIAITTYHRTGDAKKIADQLKSINPDYNIMFKGVEDRNGEPVMIHAWVDQRI